jgi:hypothetical protein
MRAARGDIMNLPKLVLLLVLGMALSACGKDEPEPKQPKVNNTGGQIGQAYKGMLDEAQKSADQANAHIRETEQRSHPDQ